MKLLFSLILSVVAFPVFSQQRGAEQDQYAKQHAATLSVTVSQQLQISRDKAINVLSLISATGTKMREVANNRTLTTDAKFDRFRQLAAERDAKISSLLSNNQVKKLQTIMAAQKPVSAPDKRGRR